MVWFATGPELLIDANRVVCCVLVDVEERDRTLAIALEKQWHKENGGGGG